MFRAQQLVHISAHGAAVMKFGKTGAQTNQTLSHSQGVERGGAETVGIKVPLEVFTKIRWH